MIATLPAPPDEVPADTIWFAICNAAIPVLAIIAIVILASAVGHKRRSRFSAAVTIAALRERQQVHPEPSGEIRGWIGSAAAFVVIVTAICVAVTHPWDAPTPYGAWQDKAAAWAESTYGAVVVDDPFGSAESCAVPSTDPCKETAVLLGGRVLKAQIAYPSGIATLVDPATGQPFAKIGATK